MKFKRPRLPRPDRSALPDASDVLTWAGAGAVALGVGMIYIPAGVIAGGLVLLALAFILDNTE